jgi:hypothetical protein
VLWRLNSLTRGTNTLEASLALPAISSIIEESMFGYLNSLTGVADTLEASLALPVISVLDEGMFREINGVLRTAHGWSQEDPQRTSEASSYQAENDPDHRSAHLTPPRGRRSHPIV